LRPKSMEMETCARNTCRGRGGIRSPTFYQPSLALSNVHIVLSEFL
jgi:hypothetical protein